MSGPAILGPHVLMTPSSTTSSPANVQGFHRTTTVYGIPATFGVQTLAGMTYLNDKDIKWLQNNDWVYKGGVVERIVVCVSVGWIAPLMVVQFGFFMVDIALHHFDSVWLAGHIILALFVLSIALIACKYQVRLLKIVFLKSFKS